MDVVPAEAVVVALGHPECASLSTDLPFPSEVEVSLQNGPSLGHDRCPRFPSWSSRMLTFLES